MRCVLHIGTKKTGTTFLQQFFDDNRAGLRDHGIHFSETLGLPSNRLFQAYFQDFRHDDFMAQRHLRSQLEKDLFFSNFEADFDAELAQLPASTHTFLISSEHLSSRLQSKQEIQRLFNFLKKRFETTDVICYFREQFQFALSSYS